MLRKKRNEKNSLSLKQFFVLIAFFFRFSGPINGDPSSRCLIASRSGVTTTRMRASGLRLRVFSTVYSPPAEKRFAVRDIKGEIVSSSV